MKKILLLFITLSPCFLLAQPRFRAGAVLGLTASQIDGDLSAGYNKLGYQAGLRVISRLKGRHEASMEILYSQRGCQNELIPSDYEIPFSLTLNYIEVPLQWHFKDWLIEYDEEKYNYYRISFNAGLSYARLFNSKKDALLSPLIDKVAPDYLKKDDLSLAIGVNFFFNRHFGITARWNRSLVLLYDPRTSPFAGKSWNQHCLYFQTVYLF